MNFGPSQGSSVQSRPNRIDRIRGLLLAFAVLAAGCEKHVRHGKEVSEDRRVGALLSTAVFTETVARSNEPPAASSGLFRFRWPVPAIFEVEERTTKHGGQILTSASYLLTNSNGKLLLSCVGADGLEINGQRLTNAELKRLEDVLRVNHLGLPDLVVDSKGAWCGVTNYEQALIRSHALLRSASPNVVDLDVVMSTFTNGSARAAYSAMLSRFWRCWVQDWIGWDVPAGTSRTNTVKLQYEGHRPKFEATIVSRHLGAATNRSGMVRLRRDELVGDGNLVACVNNALMDMDISTGRNPAKQANDVVDIARLCITEAVTDPETLVPVQVATRTKAIFKMADGNWYTNLESHQYSFRWRSLDETNGAETSTKP